MRSKVMHILFWFRRDTFDYDVTRFDDGVKYGVYYGGTQPLKRGENGVLLGDVARVNWSAEWFATPDSGDADRLRWFRGFKTRQEASLFLLGMKAERDRSACHFGNGGMVPLTEVYTGTLRFGA